MIESIKSGEMKADREVGKLTALLKQKFPNAVLDFHSHRSDETVVIERDSLDTVCRFLRDDSRCAFEIMLDITAVDGLEMNMKPRFEMVYHFKSLTHASRIRIKVPLEEDDCRIASISPIWKSADWYERECFDMFGIIFEGHPDLRRILMYEEFEGHPLRKDYPIDKQQPLMELKEIEERHTYGREL
ncbi:MAG: NADH-quinone oxidoreductase subunit C [SAR324 cluster bacterium]|jgi:NADH-quinone oxidoreductase subunit C|nr:NADH-quinone oxidoreductase subunit C [SAR324 cluster bacterium]